MESCGYILNTVCFLFQKKRIFSSYIITSHNWLEETLIREVFVCLFLRIPWLRKVKEETECLPCWQYPLRISKRKFLSLLMLTFSIWQMLIFFFLPVFLMELEINMAFCLPSNLCAAIINVVSGVLGIGFVYCFCCTSKWRDVKKTVLLIPFRLRFPFHSQKWPPRSSWWPSWVQKPTATLQGLSLITFLGWLWHSWVYPHSYSLLIEDQKLILSLVMSILRRIPGGSLILHLVKLPVSMFSEAPFKHRDDTDSACMPLILPLPFRSELCLGSRTMSSSVRKRGKIFPPRKCSWNFTTPLGRVLALKFGCRVFAVFDPTVAPTI